MIPMPYRILAMVLLLLASLGAGYVYGISRESDRRDAQDLQKERKATEVRAAQQVKADKESTRREGIGAQRETSREQIRVVYKTIREQANETVTNHPEFNDCGLDADGLREWNDANAGSPAAAPVSGEPYLSMHRAATREIGQPGGSADQSYRGDGAVQPVPGSDGKAGGVPKTGLKHE